MALGDLFCFSVAVHRRDTPPVPLERGGSGAAFLLVMSDLWRGCFLSGEGIEGCVTVRGAAWDEMFLLSCWDMLYLLLLVEL